MMSVQQRNILQLFDEMNERQLIGSHLHQELKNWILKKNDEEFKRDHIQLVRCYNLLKRLKDQCHEKLQQQTLMVDKLAQRTDLLYHSLRIHNDNTDYYSAYAILMKLELILFDTVDDFLVSDGEITPNSTLVEIYSAGSNEIDSHQLMMLQDEQEREILKNVKNDDRLSLLNELINAPLDDITIFLRQFELSFQDFYTCDFFDEVLFRLRNPPKYSNASDQIIDQLCVYIKTKLKTKYKLDRLELTTLLDDQFYKITPNKYRMHLEKFVQHETTVHFTLGNFFSFYQLDPVLSIDDQHKFATLFYIYCKKLSVEVKPILFTQSSSGALQNAHQGECAAQQHHRHNPKFLQKQKSRSSGYLISETTPARYTIGSEISVQALVTAKHSHDSSQFNHKNSRNTTRLNHQKQWALQTPSNVIGCNSQAAHHTHGRSRNNAKNGVSSQNQMFFGIA